MTDSFRNVADQVSAPATRAWGVVPHDSNPLSSVPKALYVGQGGTVVLRAAGDTADATFANVPTGSVLPVRASHLRATGTTAGAIVALG